MCSKPACLSAANTFIYKDGNRRLIILKTLEGDLSCQKYSWSKTEGLKTMVKIKILHAKLSALSTHRLEEKHHYIRCCYFLSSFSTEFVQKNLLNASKKTSMQINKVFARTVVENAICSYEVIKKSNVS